MRRELRFGGPLLLLCLIALAGCAASTALESGMPREIEGVGDSVEFPREVGSFTRGKILAYATGLTDVSIGYNFRSGKNFAASTIYFYPVYHPGPTAAASLDREFETVKSHMDRFPSGCWVERRAPVQVGQASGPREGLTATYLYVAALRGEAVEVFTVLHLFLIGDHFVKFRHTYPVVSADLYRPDIDALMRTLKWEGIDESNIAAALSQPS